MSFTYITPEEAARKEIISGKTHVKYYQKLANKKGVCSNCDSPIWKLADTGMCFSCTTGEADPSDDYELI